MTTPTTAERADSSLTRDLIHALRYYLGNWRALLVLAAIIIVAGLALNWSWLVAVGLAPILLSTLPCLVMCAIGVCAMCRSGDRQSAPVREVAEEASPRATLAVTATDDPAAGVNQPIPLRDAAEGAARGVAMDDPTAGVARCCQGQMSDAKPPQTIDLQSNEEGRHPMRKHTKGLLIASALVTSFAVAPALFAQDGHEDGMMGRGGMMGMMNMMPRMSRMMDHCGTMMQGGSRPNDQWRRENPAAPEKKG